jgi:lipopolysaccharide export LptBFGC system permease protein LptF
LLTGRKLPRSIIGYLKLGKCAGKLAKPVICLCKQFRVTLPCTRQESFRSYKLKEIASSLKPLFPTGKQRQDKKKFRVIFWKQISIAIAVIAMGLLSLPLLVGSTREVSASQRIVLGGIIGIVFYLLQQMTGNLAGLFNLVPSLTILAPVVALLSFAVAAQFWRGFGKH